MVFLMSSLSGCHRYEQIRVTSGKIESLSLNGFRAVDLTVRVAVENPAGKVEIFNAEGVLKHFGKIIGKVTPGPVTLMPRTEGEYQVNVHVELAEGLGFKEIMSFMDMRRLGECTLDVTLSGKVSGVRMKKKYVDIPLKKLLESKRNEKI